MQVIPKTLKLVVTPYVAPNQNIVSKSSDMLTCGVFCEQVNLNLSEATNNTDNIIFFENVQKCAVSFIQTLIRL